MRAEVTWKGPSLINSELLSPRNLLERVGLSEDIGQGRKWNWRVGLKGPRPLHLLTLRPHGVGEDWEALLSVGNQNRTKEQETDSARTFLCDLWADAGLRMDKLREPRAFALVGSFLGPGHVDHPHWGGLRGESHSPTHIRDVSSVL